MNAVGDLVFPAFALFLASLVLTAISLWVGGRLAPWFLKEAVEPPTVRSYFFEPMADVDLGKARMVTLLIATAIMLFALLVMAVAVRFGGVPLV
jgi:hypothetical protein